MMDENLIQFVKNEILSYINIHPDSADTLEGVHQWWIQWPDIPESIVVTAAALAQLEAEHLMERRRFSSQEVWRRRLPT